MSSDGVWMWANRNGWNSSRWVASGRDAHHGAVPRPAAGVTCQPLATAKPLAPATATAGLEGGFRCGKLAVVALRSAPPSASTATALRITADGVGLTPACRLQRLSTSTLAAGQAGAGES